MELENRPALPRPKIQSLSMHQIMSFHWSKRTDNTLFPSFFHVYISIFSHSRECFKRLDRCSYYKWFLIGKTSVQSCLTQFECRHPFLRFMALQHCCLRLFLIVVVPRLPCTVLFVLLSSPMYAIFSLFFLSLSLCLDDSLQDWRSNWVQGCQNCLCMCGSDPWPLHICFN